MSSKRQDKKTKPIVIDVHAHVFSARDIPLAGYLHSRRRSGLLEKLLSPLVVPSIANCLRQNNPDNRNPTCNISIEIACAVMGREYREWAEALSQENVDIAAEMVATFGGIDLFVPLMIDYEYWFSRPWYAGGMDRRAGEKTRGFPTDIKEQIDLVYDRIVLPYNGRIHPFAPFCPARELAYRKGLRRPDGRGVEKHSSLELVKDAIDEKGFIGVKLYNALGYKPLGNATVEKERGRIKLHKRRGYHKDITGQEYDSVLQELYDYCQEEGIPITAHCVMDGIESYPKASYDFGQAAFWREVLHDYGELFVNLAHFGWHESQGYAGKDGWSRDICRMMVDFDHLYSDVSHHGVLSHRGQRRFREDYAEMQKDWSANWSQIKQKILFGIDWHVIKRVRGFQGFQKRYVEILRHNGLYTEREIEDFLGGNAVRFLGLLPGGKTRQRLAAFYREKDIAPPKWFTATGASP
jgi:predicted TIM-barrel fold metal-dependent hydrolase